MSKHKNTATHFFITWRTNISLPICLFSCYIFPEDKTKKLNTVVAKYIDIFNFKPCTCHSSLAVNNATLTQSVWKNISIGIY